MKKIKIIFVALMTSALIISGVAYASFPVKKENKTEQNNSKQNSSEEQLTKSDAYSVDDAKLNVSDDNASTKGLDEKWILLLLWFFLGGVAAHRWYAKKPVGWNILFILTLGGCGVWAIVDLVNILTDNFN